MPYILLDREENTCILTINNPPKLNMFDVAILNELNERLLEIEKDNELRCLIVTGSGEKAFVAGGDIALQNTFGVIEAYAWSALGISVLKRLENLPMPVIGAINGYALGGGLEIALCCDILIFAENAVVGLPETGFGTIPGFGGTQRLPRKIGLNKAKEMIFTGNRIDAAEAYRIGLANLVVKQKNLMQEARKMALKICENGPIAVRRAKTAINRGIQCDIDTGLIIEAGQFTGCYATQDQKIAMTAFINKQKNFKFINA